MEDQQLDTVQSVEKTNPHGTAPFRPLRQWYIGERLTALFGACLVTGSVVIFALGHAKPPAYPKQSPVLVQAPAPAVRVPAVPNPYEGLDVEAKSVVVYDVRSDRELYRKEAESVLPLASLTKLMTSLVAVESYDGAKHVAVSQQAIDTEGDSGLGVNESWKLSDLLGFTLVTSSNDGADAVAAAVGGLFTSTPEIAPEYERVDAFVERMNERARELGLAHTVFHNATGLDDAPGGEGGSGTAHDVSRLLAYLWQQHPDIVKYTAYGEYPFTSDDGVVHQAINTNEYVSDVPGLLASKTGFTNLAGGNLAIMYDAGLDHPIVIVVLGSSREGRFSDVQKLVDATYEYVASGWYEQEMAGSTPEQV